MTEKDIENAAGKESKHPFIEIERKGFIRGAKWRINSVWHFDKSAPNPNEPFLFIFHKGVIVLQVQSEEDWNLLVKSLISVKWAYIKDLIPNTED